MQHLVLASSSPRRKELLENLQLTFDVSSSNVDETFDPKLKPNEVVMELASRKANAIAKQYPQSFVIGSDTVVVSNGRILGKPANRTEALSMLKELSGKTHSVFTGVAIVSPLETVNFYEKTDVTFWELTETEMNLYVDSGESFDKAGGYGIQGFGSMLVKKIAGDYFAVVGLPVSRTLRELQKLGFQMPSSSVTK